MLGLSLTTLVSRLVALLIAFSVHEGSHALMAYNLGDDTAARAGRLTLNPLAHLDPIGTLMVLVAGFGWAKPVPVNPYRLRNGPVAGTAMVAAAGPASNLLLAIIFAAVWRLSSPAILSALGMRQPFGILQNFMYEMVLLNIVLAVFNLIPLSPLDGASVLRGLLPREWAYELEKIQPYGPFILMGLVMADFVLPFSILWLIMGPPINLLMNLMW